MKKLITHAVFLLVLCSILCGAASAAEIDVDPASAYCFREEDFIPAEEETLSGIYVSAVPSSAICEIHYGSRKICAGDVLTTEALSHLTAVPVSTSACEGSLYFRPIRTSGLGSSEQMKLHIGRKNEAPVAKNSDVETYRDTTVSGELSAEDPDGDRLTFSLVQEPKYGTVEIGEDGTFVYTPGEKKVGKDSFTFTAEDPSGHVSNEASVQVRIVRPCDRAVYSDMHGQPGEYHAMWMKDNGLYQGRIVAGNLCFEPDASVSRGDFLAMSMQLLEKEPADAVLTSGFADESDTPIWMRPYVVSALRNGYVSGSSTEAGVVFRPADALTHAEAAVMLQNMLKFPVSSEASSFPETDDLSAVPVWAQGAVSALQCAGLPLPSELSQQSLTRLEAAKLLCSLQSLLSKNKLTK